MHIAELSQEREIAEMVDIFYVQEKQAPDIDGMVYITAGQVNIDDIVKLKITDSTDYDLIGEIVE